MMPETIPSEVQKIGLVLLLSFLIGLEREEDKRDVKVHYVFGGVRSFPLLGMLGYTTALLTPEHPAVLAVGLASVAALMLLSFQHKLRSDRSPGITSEVSGILTFLLGAVVYHEHFWIATALVVVGLLLLELKTGLEGLAKRIEPGEILTFTKFLLLAAVILPVLPNTPLTRFQVNPQRAWLIVVAISGISYVSYLLQKIIGNRGIIFSAILGGAYSSTATTIALSKRSVGQNKARLYSGAILVSSGVMYLRLAVLISIFSAVLRVRLAPLFSALGIVTILFGMLWSRRGGRQGSRATEGPINKNPLEVRSAILFAGLFLVMLVVTPLIIEYLGVLGVYGLSVVTGVTDVDPFILGLTQTAGKATPVLAATAGVIIAAASNNFAKGIYARIFADRDTGKMCFILLGALALTGLLPLAFFLSER